MLAFVNLKYFDHQVYFVVVLQDRHLAFIRVWWENKVLRAAFSKAGKGVKKLFKRGFWEEFCESCDSLNISLWMSLEGGELLLLFSSKDASVDLSIVENAWIGNMIWLFLAALLIEHLLSFWELFLNFIFSCSPSLKPRMELDLSQWRSVNRIVLKHWVDEVHEFGREEVKSSDLWAGVEFPEKV